MYVNLVGVWIAAQAVPNSLAPPRTAVPIDWPRGEDGTIVVDVLDQNGQAVVLDLTPTHDTIKFQLGLDFLTGALISLSGTATAGDRPGRYTFAMPGSQLSQYRGPLVYSVVVSKGGLTQQVVPPAYFNSTPSLVS